MANTLQEDNPAVLAAAREVMATFCWYKGTQRLNLVGLLGDHAGILESVDFDQSKRVIASQVMERLAAPMYASLVARIVNTLAEWNDFSELRRHDDSVRLLKIARGNVAHLKRLVSAGSNTPQSSRLASRRLTPGHPASPQSTVAGALEEFKASYMELHRAPDPKKRGTDFEVFLNDLFRFAGLDPKLGIKIDGEQIDGSLMLDSTCYLWESKWLASAVEAGAGHKFASIIGGKSRTTHGLFISINGFSAGFKTIFCRSAPFITLDGEDLYLILEGRIDLTKALRHKARYLDETGNCYRPLKDYLAES